MVIHVILHRESIIFPSIERNWHPDGPSCLQMQAGSLDREISPGTNLHLLVQRASLQYGLRRCIAFSEII
jgi:hypothetical protein